MKLFSINSDQEKIGQIYKEKVKLPFLSDKMSLKLISNYYFIIKCFKHDLMCEYLTILI